jgi:hypothetical protein
MHPKRSVSRHQQARVRKHASNCDSYTFFNLLTSPDLLDEVGAKRGRSDLFRCNDQLSWSRNVG